MTQRENEDYNNKIKLEDLKCLNFEFNNEIITN